jgi:integrase
MGQEAIAVYLVSNGNYWRAEWRTRDGLKRGRSIGNKAKFTKREANACCRKLSNELSGQRVTSGGMRLSEWVDFFIDSHSDKAKTTRAKYRDCGLYLTTYFEHDPPIDQITPAHAAEWLAAMSAGVITAKLEAARDASKKHNPYTVPSLFTIRCHVRTAKQMFEDADDQDRISKNPFRKLNGSVPRVSKKWRQVTPGDIAKILGECPGEHWKMLFRLCRFAGLRLSEALYLRWEDIDIPGNRMAVNAWADGISTKRRPRVVPIEPARCPSGLLESLSVAARAGTGPCSGITRGNLRRTVHGILTRSGVGVYAKPLHTLRKCCETDWASHYPQHVVSEWIGHDISVSAAHYLRVPEEMYARPDWGQIGGKPVRKGRQVADRQVITGKAEIGDPGPKNPGKAASHVGDLNP